MAQLRPSRRWCLQTASVCAAALISGVPVHAARDIARGTHGDARHVAKRVVPSAWEQAEQGRADLETKAEADRTHAEYAHAMDVYRAIYHSNPADVHAPAAVNAVAELLAEQGRIFHDAKSLQAAVGQYEFLRKQYPGSSLRVQALLTEGEIEQNDLSDATAARSHYAELLRSYPKSEQAEEARAGIASLKQERTGKPHEPASSASAAIGTQAPAMSAKAPAGNELTDLQDVDAQTRPSPGPTAAPRHSGGRAVVSGVRHWSTPTYTRVAIDLGDKVTYEAARVPHPDRIYFDLHGTRLAQDLVGKSFNITDDGFLKCVRAAQYSDDVTRVVLDVSDVSDYSAFLLPNPTRLIIDIHGAKPAVARSSRGGTKDAAPAASSASAATSSPQNVPAPHTAAAMNATAARPVPNSVATRNPDTANELADLSGLPGKVEATRKPTSKPISAVVKDDGGTDAVADAASTDAPSSNPAAVGKAPEISAAVPAPAAAIDSRRTRRGRGAAAGATPARAAAPMADGETSLVRALGLKIGRIVIDAGHGGHDSGTLGAGGIEEKDVVLDVALRLGKLLHDRLGAEIIYTRSDDTFIPLETRTAIANKAQADLFISIHANSSPDETARGVEVYYLNFTSDPTALDVAARENAVSDQSIHQLSDLVKKITLKDKISESHEFASDVESSLYSGLARGNAGLKDRGVKKAPFVVLIGANMPSILAEISFVTNPRDADQLRDPDYRERVAESLYKGVAHYEAGLSAAKPAATERASVGN